MLYVLSFAGGAIFGVVMMCCFIVSGQESRMEEKYLKENHKERYRTLVRFGKLAEKMQEVEEEANGMMEALENSYLKQNPPKNPQSTMEMWKLREQARMQAEEIVMKEVVLKFH